MTKSVALTLSLLVTVGCASSVDRMLPDPVQGPISESPVSGSGGRIVGIADFSSVVVILRRERYVRGNPDDPLSDYSPMDIVAGWGQAGRAAVRRPVHLAQGRRRYAFWYAGGPDVPKETLAFGSMTANWHLIPADASVGDAMDDIGVGDVVRFEGRLVRVRLRDGSWASSSLSRNDSGDGACEILLVERIRTVR